MVNVMTLRMIGRIGLASLICLNLSCGESDDGVTSKSGGEPEQPAAAAGMSSERGPGVPNDFAGEIRQSLVLDAEQKLRMVESDALTVSRNPPTQDARDRGFGRPAKKPSAGIQR